MNTPPTLSQISGIHSSIYESLYNQVDGSNSNQIEAPKAAAFLKTSSLSDRVLSQIWDLADPDGKGYLNKRGLFVALKLIALCQAGRSPSLLDIQMSVGPPKLALEKFHDKIDWTIKPSERAKYEELFNSMSMMSDRVHGSKIRPVMMQSKLRVDLLTKIWDLSDIDQDGSLVKEEFIIAMHLMAKLKENPNCIPISLPPELLPVSAKSTPKSEDWSAFDGITSPQSDTKSISSIRSVPTSWVVNAIDKAKFDDMFLKLDTDFDGFVTGEDVKATFIQTGLPQSILAHIWSLCDLKLNGKLNSEQFALAMYFVGEKKDGREIPSTLTPEMIPPTLRPKPTAGPDTLMGSPQSNGSAKQSAYPQNKELEDLSKELKELQAEKEQLELEVGEQEKLMKLKQSDVKNFQNEIETLQQMVKQLDNQKVEARKRLVEMGIQAKTLEKENSEIKQLVDERNIEVENLRKQVEEKKDLIDNQEAELSAKKTELEKIKEDESHLEEKVGGLKQEIDALSRELTSSQLQMSQYKARALAFEEFERALKDGKTELELAIAQGDVYKLTNILTRPITAPDLFDDNGEVNGDEADAGFPSLSNAFIQDPFAGENLFTEDPFQKNIEAGEADPFGGNTFGGTDSRTSVEKFNADPFSNSGGRSANESPTPELPPKKGKGPPPRPAPPKTHGNKPPPRPPAPDDPATDPWGSAGEAAPSPPISRDPFASSAGSASEGSFAAFGNFADFSNFDKA